METEDILVNSVLISAITYKTAFAVLQLKTFMEVVKVTDKEIAEVMKRCETDNEGYIICPHTAAALASAYR